MVRGVDSGGSGVTLVTHTGVDALEQLAVESKHATKIIKRAVLTQGGPRDVAAYFDTYRVSNFTTASCGFSATARLSCIKQRPFKG